MTGKNLRGFDKYSTISNRTGFVNRFDAELASATLKEASVSFKVGEKVVYPNHGIGVIEKITTTDISGAQNSFYLLRLKATESPVIVPIAYASEIGLRSPINTNQCDRLLEALSADFSNPPVDWKDRHKDFLEKMKTGDIFHVAEVLKNLTYLSLRKSLSFRELRMLQRARYLIISELSLVYEKDETAVERSIDNALKASCSNHARNAATEKATALSNNMESRSIKSLVSIEVTDAKDIQSNIHRNRNREQGKVKWFNATKGYGFLTRSNGEDAFVHYQAIETEGYKSLYEGQQVEFTIIQGPKGSTAISVVPIAEIKQQEQPDLKTRNDSSKLNENQLPARHKDQDANATKRNNSQSPNTANFVKRVLRIGTIAAIVIAVLLWGFTIIRWIQTEPGYEPLNALIAAILSSLLGFFGWLRSHRPIDKNLMKGKDESNKKNLSTTSIGKNTRASMIVTGGNVTVINSATSDSTALPSDLSSPLAEGAPEELKPSITKGCGKELDKNLGTEFIEQELPSIIRKLTKDRRILKVIVMVDIDQLTLINKHYGREVGDEVISIVAGLIKVREAITYFGRCGDDTFYAVLMKADDRKASKVCERIRRSIEVFEWQGIAPDLRVTCTLGYALLEPNENPVDWIKRSIHGMLEGKKKGGNIISGGPMFSGKRFLPKRNSTRFKRREDIERYYPSPLKLREFFS